MIFFKRANGPRVLHSSDCIHNWKAHHVGCEWSAENFFFAFVVGFFLVGALVGALVYFAVAALAVAALAVAAAVAVAVAVHYCDCDCCFPSKLMNVTIDDTFSIYIFFIVKWQEKI